MGFLKSIMSPRSSMDSTGVAMSPRSPSFNEMSMGSGEDLEAYMAAKNDPVHVESPAAHPKAPFSQGSPRAAGRRAVWQRVFNPGRNYNENMRQVGSQYWDSVEGDRGVHPSIWDHVLLAERYRTFDSLDKDKDGFLNAQDLTRALGHSEDVKQLIAAADTNGDGRIDRAEFQQLLENSTVAH